MLAVIEVFDRRSYHKARAEVNTAAAAGDFPRAWSGCVAICCWLDSEQHRGRRARRERVAADLQIWTARRAEFNPRPGGAALRDGFWEGIGWLYGQDDVLGA
ncbi:hypothetical protein [Amycolatopsis nigrescens]|uniref:hypothetical protein n=1 Tax=Amycolatopsis nigrescens TaxID=381445 RepID=UPI000376D5DA|nr:hypothetical protein [Amycolatopsis nigrescens]